MNEKERAELEQEAINTLREIHTDIGVKKSIRVRAAATILAKTTASPRSLDISIKQKTTIIYKSPQDTAARVIAEDKEKRLEEKKERIITQLPLKLITDSAGIEKNE